MKGIIAMADDDRRFVVQGVHMLIEGGSQARMEEERGAPIPACLHRPGSTSGPAEARI